MKHLLVSALLPLSLALLGACNHTSTPAKSAQLEPYTCGSMQRLHTIDGIYLGSQPAQADLTQAKETGIKTVVSLRHTAEVKDWDEAASVRAQGMEWIQIPWNGPDQLTDEVFDRSREALRSAQRPMLFNCGSGNRVGAVWIAFRVLDEGLPLEAAVTEAKTIGLKTPEFETKARDYVARKVKG
jgi:uncharacterized protein (TIGR01244 family)